MNKKGMAWSTIVYAIIAIIVLVVIVWIFRKQINEIYKSFMGIIKGATAGSEDIGKSIEELSKK